MKFAADHPELVRTLTVIGGAVKGGDTTQWRADIEARGVASWAAASMTGRFGTMLSPEAIRCWVDLTARTPLSTMQSYLRWVPTVDIAADVGRIRCPTLVIAADAGKLRPLGETTSWQEKIADSELVTLPCDGWHIGGAKPRECARLTREFLVRRGS
jgi:3-oxoadipate enol-lactonase